MTQSISDQAKELLPCPFCGGEARPHRALKNSEYRLYPVVRCTKCNGEACGDNDDYSMDAQSAVKSWNQRGLNDGKKAVVPDGIQSPEYWERKITNVIAAGQNRETIAAIQQEAISATKSKVRRKALEEAAKEIEDDDLGTFYAAAIRALINKEGK